MRYEHKVVDIENMRDVDLEQIMDQLSDEDWDLIGMNTDYILLRRIREEPPCTDSPCKNPCCQVHTF